MSLNDRISMIIEYAQKTPSEFAEEIDVPRSSISHLTSGRNKPSLDFLIKIKNRFPEIGWDWLITGNGTMTAPEEIMAEEKTKKPVDSPNLFSLIDDQNFGITESEDRTQKLTPRESAKTYEEQRKKDTSDSQPLQNNPLIEEKTQPSQTSSAIKRIVFFYENGKFEAFEP